jgi:CRISPR-associated protein Cas1
MLSAGYQVIRYADDVAIPAPDRATAERALADAQEALAALRLELDPAKSRAVSFDEGVAFLGQTVTATTGLGVEALSHPLETVVYVDRQRSLLRSRGDRLVVEHQDKAVFRLNLRRVRQVVCLGRVGMTTAFLHQALDRGIDVFLLNASGSLGGRLSSLAHNDPTARRAQYRVADDPDRALVLARSFVAGKVANMRVGLVRADRRGPDPARADAAATLEVARLVLEDTGSIEEVMGHEGMATREYFHAWRLVWN